MFNVYIVSICVFSVRAHLIWSLALLCVPHLRSSFLTRGYAKRRNGFLLGLRYANVSLAHSGVESS